MRGEFMCREGRLFDLGAMDERRMLQRKLSAAHAASAPPAPEPLPEWFMVKLRGLEKLNHVDRHGVVYIEAKPTEWRSLLATLEKKK